MNRIYNSLMARPLTKPRSKRGAKLLQLRLEAGISQTELADLINEPQQNVAYWERSEKPPRSDVLPKIAKALGINMEDILNAEAKVPKKNGPTGRLQIVFEEVSALPRRQQQKIIEVVSAIVTQYKQTKTA